MVSLVTRIQSCFVSASVAQIVDGDAALIEIISFSRIDGQILATCGVGAISVLSTILATFVVDRAGRRPLLLWGLAIMLVSLAVPRPSIAGTVIPTSPVVAVSGLAIFVCASAFSTGPIPYVIMSEVFPIRLRSLGMSLAAASARSCNVIVTMTILIMLERMGQSNLFWCYCGIRAIGLAFSFFTAPETKNCSLEDIEANLKAGVNIRDLGRQRNRA